MVHAHVQFVVFAVEIFAGHPAAAGIGPLLVNRTVERRRGGRGGCRRRQRRRFRSSTGRRVGRQRGRRSVRLASKDGIRRRWAPQTRFDAVVVVVVATSTTSGHGGTSGLEDLGGRPGRQRRKVQPSVSSPVADCRGRPWLMSQRGRQQLGRSVVAAAGGGCGGSGWDCRDGDGVDVGVDGRRRNWRLRRLRRGLPLSCCRGCWLLQLQLLLLDASERRAGCRRCFHCPSCLYGRGFT